MRTRCTTSGKALKAARRFTTLWAWLASAAASCAASPAIVYAPPPTQVDLAWVLPDPPMPADNVGTPERIDLGRRLFFDIRLSGDGSRSCASCHVPVRGWADGFATAIGLDGQILRRATPTVLNTAYNTRQMWDGRKRSLEEQALGPLKAADEMNADMPSMVKRLSTQPLYARLFSRAYPGEPVSEATLGKAIAAFERTLVVRDSAFDRWLAGDPKAMTMPQWRGYQAFMDPKKGNCVACHAAPNFTDDGYHNIGIGASAATPDVGRFAVVGVPSMRGAFKTSTLRNIEDTAPYFHDGSASTLREVVDHYVRIGDHKPANVSINIAPLRLSEQDKDDLVAFMKALTGSRPSVAIPLPMRD